MEEELGFRGFGGLFTILSLWSNTGHCFFDLEIVPFCKAWKARSNEVFFKIFGRSFLGDGRGLISALYIRPLLSHAIYLFYNVLIRPSNFNVEIISAIFWVVQCIFFHIFEEKNKWADLLAYTPPPFLKRIVYWMKLSYDCHTYTVWYWALYIDPPL